MTSSDLTINTDDFGNQSDENRSAIAVYGALQSAIKLLRDSLPSTVEIHSSLQTECGFVMASAAQIYHVVLNFGEKCLRCARRKTRHHRRHFG